MQDTFHELNHSAHRGKKSGAWLPWSVVENLLSIEAETLLTMASLSGCATHFGPIWWTRMLSLV